MVVDRVVDDEGHRFAALVLEEALGASIGDLVAPLLVRSNVAADVGDLDRLVVDVLVAVLIADAVQNAMGSEYRSVTEGALLVLTIVFWDRALDWLGDQFPRLRRFTRPPPLLLIEDGRLLHHNMRHEMITMEELLSELRQQGVDNPTDVKCAFMEGNGEVSVLRRDRRS